MANTYDTDYEIYKAKWDIFYNHMKTETGEYNIHIIFNEKINQLYRFNTFNEAHDWNFKRFMTNYGIDLQKCSMKKFDKAYNAFDSECNGDVDSDWSAFAVGSKGFYQLINIGFELMN